MRWLNIFRFSWLRGLESMNGVDISGYKLSKGNPRVALAEISRRSNRKLHDYLRLRKAQTVL